MNNYSYTDLFLWLLENTELDDDFNMSNKELRDHYLNNADGHDEKYLQRLPSKMGQCLRIIYGLALEHKRHNGLTIYNITLK